MKLVHKHPETSRWATAWHKAARRATWQGIHQVREQFPSADQAGRVLVFNVLGGNYRLITAVHYPTQRLFVKALLTHGEYDRREWMKWA
jgi:mRNA interferase HigB